MEICVDLFTAIQAAQTALQRGDIGPALKGIQQALLDVVYAPELPGRQVDIFNAQLTRADALRRAYRASECGPQDLIREGIVKGLQIASLLPCHQEPFPDFRERLSDILQGRRDLHFPVSEYPLMAEDQHLAEAGFSDIYRAQIPIGAEKLDGVVKRYKLDGLAPSVMRSVPLGGFFNELRFQGAVDVFGNALSASLRRVQIIDFGYDSGPYVVLHEMKGGNGVKIAEIMQGLDDESKIEIVRQMTECIALAHRDGIVHRDISPKNFMRDEHGRIHILDFGLSGTPEEIATAEENRFGYGPVLPPEALMDVSAFHANEYLGVDDISPTFRQSYRSDVYSLCASVLIMLTNRFELNDAQYHALICKFLDAPNSSEFSAVPESLKPILKRGMALNPPERFINAADMLNEIWESAEPKTKSLDAALGTQTRRIKRVAPMIGVQDHKEPTELGCPSTLI